MRKLTNPAIVGRRFRKSYNFKCVDMRRPAGCLTTAYQNETSMACLIRRGNDFYKFSHEEAKKRLLTVPIDYEYSGNQDEQMEQLGSCIPPHFMAQWLGHIRKHFL